MTMFTASKPNNNSSSTTHRMIHNSNKKNPIYYSSSIMDHPRISSEQKVEIQGYYWPRIILAPLEPTNQATSSFCIVHPKYKNSKLTVHHKKKKSTKEKLRTIKNFLIASPTSTRAVVPPCDDLPSNSLLELLHDVPCLMPEYQRKTKDEQIPRYASLRSPITGKLLAKPTTGVNFGRSRLIVGPTKKKKNTCLELPSKGS